MKLYLIICDTKTYKGHIYDVLHTKEEAKQELWEAEDFFPSDYNFRIEEMEIRK